jgi:hypothetical protein
MTAFLRKTDENVYIAQNKNYDEMTAIDANLLKLVDMAKKSAKSGEREVM